MLMLYWGLKGLIWRMEKRQCEASRFWHQILHILLSDNVQIFSALTVTLNFALQWKVMYSQSLSLHFKLVQFLTNNISTVWTCWKLPPFATWLSAVCTDRFENRSSRFLQNVCNFQADYTTSHSRTQYIQASLIKHLTSGWQSGNSSSRWKRSDSYTNESQGIVDPRVEIIAASRQPNLILLQCWNFNYHEHLTTQYLLCYIKR